MTKSEPRLVVDETIPPVPVTGWSAVFRTGLEEPALCAVPCVALAVIQVGGRRLGWRLVLADSIGALEIPTEDPNFVGFIGPGQTLKDAAS